MNLIGVQTIFFKEMRRIKKIVVQAFLAPVLTTFLYFLVFGTTLGERVGDVQGVSYALFIVPGLIMMSILMNSLLAASHTMYFPRFVGTINDLLAAPLSFFEISLGFAGAAAVRSVLIGATIFGVSWLFTGISVEHIFFTIFFIVLVSLTFAFMGIVIGVVAKDFEGLTVIPTLVLTPLSFLGGMFYSIEMLPAGWQKVTLANPIYYMMDGLRYGFFGTSSVHPLLSLGIICAIFLAVTGFLAWIFRTGYKLKS